MRGNMSSRFSVTMPPLLAEEAHVGKFFQMLGQLPERAYVGGEGDSTIYGVGSLDVAALRPFVKDGKRMIILGDQNLTREKLEKIGFKGVKER